MGRPLEGVVSGAPSRDARADFETTSRDVYHGTPELVRRVMEATAKARRIKWRRATKARRRKGVVAT